MAIKYLGSEFVYWIHPNQDISSVCFFNGVVITWVSIKPEIFWPAHQLLHFYERCTLDLLAYLLTNLRIYIVNTY